MKEYRKTATVFAKQMNRDFDVNSLEGHLTGKKGDYLCIGVDNEKWIVRKDIFERTYKEV